MQSRRVGSAVWYALLFFSWCVVDRIVDSKWRVIVFIGWGCFASCSAAPGLGSGVLLGVWMLLSRFVATWAPFRGQVWRSTGRSNSKLPHTCRRVGKPTLRQNSQRKAQALAVYHQHPTHELLRNVCPHVGIRGIAWNSCAHSPYVTPRSRWDRRQLGKFAIYIPLSDKNYCRGRPLYPRARRPGKEACAEGLSTVFGKVIRTREK